MSIYLEKAKQMYLSFWKHHPAPCTQQEIEELERILGLKLPASFAEYLLWMGQGADLYPGSEFFYWPLSFLREGAEEILAEDEFDKPLPKDAIVFYHHGGNEFSFIRASEGENPPVYFYGSGYQDFRKTHDHFSQYLEKVIQHRIEYLIREKQREEEEAKLTKEQKMERAKQFWKEHMEKERQAAS